MSSALGIHYFSTKHCLVVPSDVTPMCSNGGLIGHIISISAKDNYWCQWVYQFAHEYCHHLINGSLSGEWSTLLWFEETICQLSSLYNLRRMEDYCRDIGLAVYAPCVHDYLDKLLAEGSKVFVRENKVGWFEKYASSLSKEGYQRGLYNAIAVQIFPLFIDNPNLWKIILHIGDIRSWDSLESLFVHLQERVDDSYKDSWCMFRGLFFPGKSL